MALVTLISGQDCHKVRDKNGHAFRIFTGGHGRRKVFDALQQGIITYGHRKLASLFF
jgi:hypothetical protein